MIRIFSVLIFLYVCTRSNISSLSTQERNKKMDHLREVISSKCSVKYTSHCLLLDLSTFIDRLSVAGDFQILPGIFIVSNKSAKVPSDIFEQATNSNQSEKLDVHAYVRDKLQTYLDSLSITWKIMDRNSAFSVRHFSDDLIKELLPSTIIARGKKKNGKESVMWAAGAMAALGTSALFVITGKAAIASLTALMLSLLCYFKGSGHSGYVAATQAAYATPYKSQCTEAVFDVNGRDTVAMTGYKKRITDDYQRYAPMRSDSIRGSEQPIFHENTDYSNSKMFTVKAK